MPTPGESRRPPPVALLGTGLMGKPMAMRLIAAGHAVTVWNRTPAKASELLERGARWADTPASAAAEAGIVLVMLADGPSVTEVLWRQGAAAALRPQALLICMTSLAPGTAREHAGRLAQRGVRYLDAPVSGGTRAAEAGTLAIMVGGEPETFASARPVLSILGRPTWIGAAGSGQLCKLANQVIVGTTIAAVAEALLLAQAGGADPAKVREALSGGFADSAILRQHGKRMLERSWIPGGTVTMQLKDLRTALAVASESSLDLPLTRTAEDLYRQAVNEANCDHSAVLLELERRNPGTRVGIKPDQRPTA